MYSLMSQLHININSIKIVHITMEFQQFEIHIP